MSDPDEITLLRLHPQVTEDVMLAIPVDTLAVLREVAETRDMSLEALLRFYIGRGLREDLADSARPNATTLRALKDARAGKLKSFGSPAELFVDLGISDP
ncbi:MAG: hypothetical protein ACJ8J0_19605 [Longimicrobiaceae bacterium]